ncbi:VWA domain-containing protein, partial [Salmonella enterica subsp. enterica serovar Virchow]|nr:VWA domain-containing protein [Salmonella enterica subsp. enterica serovar Virchow]
DLPETIHATAEHGYLDVRTRPERRNAVKLLMFFDVGGSMDDHIKVVEELFSAARAEFRQLEFFYFHNCLYEGVWKDNGMRRADTIPTFDVLHKYGHDYKVVFVGDASMSPYEIVTPGGSVEHWNEEAGAVWLQRALDQWPNAVWINPVRRDYWGYTQSIAIVDQIFSGRMYPLTLSGLEGATKELSRKH